MPYDAHFINIFKNEQFGSEFTSANPNSKIPTLIDKRPSFGSNPVSVFESCNILRYLCDKHPSSLYPTDPGQRLECDNWLFFQHGCVGPYFGQFGHFYCYAPCKLPYAIDRLGAGQCTTQSLEGCWQPLRSDSLSIAQVHQGNAAGAVCHRQAARHPQQYLLVWILHRRYCNLSLGSMHHSVL